MERNTAMLKTHKYWLGLFWLVAIFVLPLPLIQTLSQGMSGTLYQSELFASQIGTIAYVWMLFAIVVSEKPKWLDRLIGLPEMYFAHGIIGIGAIVLAFVHAHELQSVGLIKITGDLALYLFIAVALYSMFFMSGWLTSRSRLMGKLKKKLEQIFRYETSVWIHRLNIVATLFVFAHVILIDYIRVISPFMTWFYAYSAFTAATYIYMHSLKKLSFHTGRLMGNQKLADNITELTIYVKRSMNFYPGDFAFISFPEIPDMKESHPFSVLRYDRRKHELVFAIRNEADFTTNINEVKLGSKVIIDGTYGRLYHEINERKSEHLILIGSGIGSVPLISLALNRMRKQKVTFIRIAHRPQDLIYENLIRENALKHENLTYYSQIGRLTSEQIESLIDSKAFYLLGGSPQMMRGTQELLMNSGILKDNIYGEKFSF